MKLRRIMLSALAIMGTVGLALPAAAQQQRQLCVNQLPFAPVAPDTGTRLVIYQAYPVPDVKSDHTLVSYYAQFQNQSSGTVSVTVTPQIGRGFPTGARWMQASTSFNLRSYWPTEVVVGILRVPGQITQRSNLPDAWSVVNAMTVTCPGR